MSSSMERLNIVFCWLVVTLVVFISWTSGEPQIKFPYAFPIIAESSQGKPVGIYGRSSGGSVFVASVNNSKIGVYSRPDAVSADASYDPVYDRPPFASPFLPFQPGKTIIVGRPPIRRMPPTRKSTLGPIPPRYLAEARALAGLRRI